MKIPGGGGDFPGGGGAEGPGGCRRQIGELGGGGGYFFFFFGAEMSTKNPTCVVARGSTVCKLVSLQRQVDLQGMFVKIGDFIQSKGFLVEFLENRRS